MRSRAQCDANGRTIFFWLYAPAPINGMGNEVCEVIDLPNCEWSLSE
jgi:hypothetical protein